MTLTIQDLGALGELLGSVAVLATLIYLALQTRQNTMAIGAQLDAVRLNAVQHLGLAAATSRELQEALNQNRIEARPIEEDRCEDYWASQLITWQWMFHQGRRGLLPSMNEAGMGHRISSLFNIYRGFGGLWEQMKPNLLPEFVEWVEEQRRKAA